MAKVSVIWSDYALDRVDEIGENLEKKSLQAAQNVVSAIFEKATQLEDFPLSGSLEENLKELTLKHRYLLVYNYKIIYRPIDKLTVFITDVFPCKMDDKKIKVRTNKV